jgi:hypothetical protein
MTRVALLTISDRPDLYAETIASLEDALEPDCGGVTRFALHVHVDDSAHRLGFAGAIREGWRRLAEHPDPFDYVLHLEDDWRFLEPLDLAGMTALLAARRDDVAAVGCPDLAQVALLRQPVAPLEIRAGGVVELWRESYTVSEVTLVPPDPIGSQTIRWLEHDLFFTTNPSVYRRDLLELGWPDSSRSEEVFTARCREAGYRFAFYGASAKPRVWHTGNDRREGRGY